MTQTPNTPAGWYPQGNVERWWDGNAWTVHTRPIQPTMPQPTQPQPAYGAPQTPQPQGYYPVPPVKESHTARNILIVLAVLFLLFVGGCFAMVAIVSNKVDEAVNDDTPGGPNVPLEIEPGESFEVAGFEYADGWAITTDPGGLVDVEKLKLTNNRGKTDQAFVEIKLLDNNEVLATVLCSSTDRIQEGITVTLDCYSSDSPPAAYDKVTINDAF
jgi:Protein of unknown function (DUF2510)